MAELSTSKLLLPLLAKGDSAVLGYADWGAAARATLEFLEDALTESAAIAVSGADVTLNDAEERAAYITISGVMSANLAVKTSGRKGMWIVKNSTTGAFTLTFGPDAGTKVTIPQGRTLTVYCDGTNALAVGSNVGNEVTPTDGTILVGDGVKFVGESGATARASLGANDASNLTAGTLPAGRLSGNYTFGGLTLSGNFAMDKASPTLFLNKAAESESAQFIGQTGGVNRWTVGVGAGGGASDFLIGRFTDAGAYAGGVLTASRATGIVDAPIGLTVAGNTAWHAGNDGAGSTLDADLLDGQHGAFYQNASNLNAGTLPAGRLSGNYTFGNLTLSDGQLDLQALNPRVKFTDTTANSYDFWAYVDGNTFYVLVDRDGDGAWETPHPLALNAATNTATLYGNTIWHAGNDGSGSGLDSDLLDGQHGAYYRNASNLNAGTIADARLPSHMGTKSFTDITLDGFQPTVTLDKSSGAAMIIGTNAGVLRWQIQPGTSETESGGNAGSDFIINRWTDAGGFAGTPLRISRATGLTTLDGGLTVSGRATASLSLDAVQANGGVRLAVDTNGVGYIQQLSAASDYEKGWITMYRNGAVQLLYNNASKLSTSASGVTVDGWVIADSAVLERAWNSSELEAGITDGLSYTQASIPEGAPTYGGILTLSQGASRSFQIQVDKTTGGIYARGSIDGPWSAWAKHWTDQNDGAGSGLDADKLQNATPDTASTANTIVKRDSSGDIRARLLRSEYASSNSTIASIMTQSEFGGTGNNYLRPSTPAQLASAMPIIGVDQTWQDVSASRSMTTHYQNATGRPIMVVVEGLDGSRFDVSANNSTWVTVRNLDADQDAGSNPGGIIIPAGYWYRLVFAGFLSWVELR